ncbi:MAG: c-type cytochrome [Armatimonadota bacterium]
MISSRRLTLFAVSAAGLLLFAASRAPGDDRPPIFPVQPALDGNRGPFEVAFTPDGKTAVVTEFDEDALAVIDTASGEVRAHIPTGGEEPTGVAVLPDGKTALVTNSFSGSLAFVDLQARKSEVMPLRGMPYDVVLSPDGATAYVSISQLDQVAVIDVAGRKVRATLPTGRRPRALDITPNGRVVVSANLTQGSLTFLDVVSLRPLGNGPTPAVNMRGVAIYPDGRRAYCVAQRAQNERPTETAVGIWSNQAFHVRPNGRAAGDENIWLDLLGKDVSDPESVVFDPQYRRAFITCSGGHSLNVLSVQGDYDPKAVQQIGVHPKGLAFTPDGKELWVANHLGNDLAVVNPETLEVTRRIKLGATTRKDPHLLGRFLFTTATITDGQQFSCNSCHPDGNTDGITWKFVHVKDQLGSEINRNVRSLRGELGETAPFRWSGHTKTLEDFIQDEVTGLLKTPALSEEHLKALVGFVSTQRFPPNPHRQPDGSHTEEALRGKALFEGKAGCGGCHTGPKVGGQRTAWMGTTPQGVDLDVPHLAGVYDSYPYLHDGRAATLEEIFTRHNEAKLHGRAHELSPEELNDVVQYLREL